MFELPDEIWDYIKEFTLDWKRTHKQKMKPILQKGIPFCYTPIYKRWTHFPPWPNTNDIIRAEYLVHTHYAPRPNLPLTSITWNPKGTGGWWCEYGWRRTPTNYIWRL
jgi:hypothetical protein